VEFKKGNYNPVTPGAAIDRFHHYMRMYEQGIPSEEGWTKDTLLVAMKELMWVLTGTDLVIAKGS
jgi:hypothetical protein